MRCVRPGGDAAAAYAAALVGELSKSGGSMPLSTLASKVRQGLRVDECWREQGTHLKSQGLEAPLAAVCVCNLLYEAGVAAQLLS